MIISGQEAIHVTKVLRHSVGDNILVTDGRGTGYKCEIIDINKSDVILLIKDSKKKQQYGTTVSLCMGILKKRDRLEFAVEKAVELGVHKIIIFEADHSQKANVREDRLQNTAISAMKQSVRFFRPEIFIEDSIEDAISNHVNDEYLVVADETLDKSQSLPTEKNNYVVVVGPEGGFSKNEREYLKNREPIYYSMNKHRLRTETAAIIMVDRCMQAK